MWLNSDLMKNWKPHAGVTHVLQFRCSSRCLSATNVFPISRSAATMGKAERQKRLQPPRALERRLEKLRSAKGRWNSDKSSVPCAMKTTSGALLGADSPLMARMYSSCEDLSTVPYT